MVEAALVQYADYINSTGITTLQPFDLEDVDNLRVSSALRYDALRRGGNDEPSREPTTVDPVTPRRRRSSNHGP